MALGKRREHQQHLLVPTSRLPRSPGHPFYRKLNELLKEAGFDRFAEELCAKHYSDGGRPSIPPGVYFRMLLVGYFEGISSQRGIAWRCADSLSLREFLGLRTDESTPEHSSLTRIRKRLPLEVHQEVFAFVVKVAREKGLVKGRVMAVDSTTLEANAAMKSIVRKDTGKDWNEYLRELAKEAGIEEPTDEDLRRFDRKRGGKKVSNKDWRSKTDPSSRITKMKDGRTHLAYKAQHAIDADTELVVAATIHHADEADSEILKAGMLESAGVLGSAGHDEMYRDIVADKGYHKAETLAWLAERGLRSYIPSPRSPHKRRWRDKPESWKEAHRTNRRRTGGKRSRRLQRLRSERVERSFAHVCGTGAARRTWLTGIEDITKRYVIHVAARNLSLVMRKLFGVGTPRALQGALGALWAAFALVCAQLTPSRKLRRILAVLFFSIADSPSGRAISPRFAG